MGRPSSAHRRLTFHPTCTVAPVTPAHYLEGVASLRREFAAAQARRGVLPSSIDKRDGCLRLLEDWLHPRPLTHATADDIETFLTTRKGRKGGPISDRTRYAWISHLHAFYRWAQRHGHATDDPTLVIDRPRTRPNIPRPVGEDDLRMAVDAADPQMKAWLTLMSMAGLRCAEVAGLDREDVIDHELLLRVVGKGRKERLVPIHPSVLGTLRAAGLPNSGPLFTRPDGARYEPWQVSHDVRCYLHGLGIDATAHQLRHRFGTYAYRVSRDLRTVAELMGHSSITTTMGYVAWSRDTARSAVEALPDPAGGHDPAGVA